MRILKPLLFIIMAFISNIIQASIYKIIDDKGNILFSDKKQKLKTDKVSEIIIRPINTINMIEYKPIKNIKEEKYKIKKNHYKLSITEPANLSTIRGVSNINVNVKVTPALDKRHTLELLLDGKIKESRKNKKKFILKNVYRGEHQITVRVINKLGKVLQETYSTIYVFRPFIIDDAKKLN